jgi:hypothetical protein
MKKDQTTLLFVFYPEPLCCSLTTPFHCCGTHRSSGAASRGHLGWRGGVALRWGRAWALRRVAERMKQHRGSYFYLKPTIF